MQKILCPIDFSKASLNALEFAARIGEKHQATLTLLYIFTEEEHRLLLRKRKDVSFDEWRLKTEEKLQGLIDEVKATSLKNGLRDCRFMLKQGELVKNIKEAVAESGAHIIVMGTTGVSDVTEAYVGSNTVQVIQKTTCPVLCVPEKASYKKIKKAVYATDYQEEDRRAIAQLLDFAAPFDAEVNVVHVTHRNRIFDQAIYEDFKQELKSYVNYDKLTFTVEVYEEEINLGIDRYMIEHEAELLVLLTQERTFFEKLFIKSLSKKMSYFVDYPLLIYKSASF